MQVLYQLTVLFSLAFIAIVITIYILASSLQGNAVRESAEEEETYLAKRKEKIEKMSKQLVSDTTEVSSRAIEEWNKDISKIDKKISAARRKGNFLTVKNIITIPSIPLLLAIIGSSISIVTTEIISNITWGISLFLIVFSLYWIYRNLRSIENFTADVDSRIVIQPSRESTSDQVPNQITPTGEQYEEAIEATLNSLPPREARILRFYYGIYEIKLSEVEIAQEWAITTNELKNIIARAIQMSRHRSRSRKLKRFLDDMPITGRRDAQQQFIGDIFGV